MARLPQPGSDNGQWGAILNDFLSQSHKSDGQIKDDSVTTGQLQDDSVTLAKISGAGATNGQVIGFNGTDVTWATVSGSGSVPDATTSTKGTVRLAGDLGGTADAPTVPGLSSKANDAATVHNTGNESIAGVKNFTGTLQAGGQSVVTTDDSRLTNARTPTDGSVTYPKLAVGGATQGQVLSYNGSSLAWATPGGLTPTAVKTANYTATAGEYVPVNTTSGSVTVTLPTAPADGTQIAVKIVSGGNSCIVARGGSSDVFNVDSGSTTITLTAVGIGVTLRYAAASSIWYSLDSTPLSALNGAYAPSAGPVPTAYAASTDARFVSATAGRKIANFTLALGDAGSIIEAESATAITATVPPASSVAFLDNTLIEICQTGDGQITVAPGSGVTLRAPGGTKTRTQWSSISLRRRPGSGSTLPTANMLMRFKADDISGANGSSVSSWPESSGNNHPAATQGVTANQPTLVTNIINGHKAVYFDGLNDFLQLTGSALDVTRNRSALTVFIAYMYPSTYSGTRTLMSFSNGLSSTNSRAYVSLKDSLGALGAGGRRLDANSLAFTSGSTTPVAGEVAVATARFVYSSSDLYLYKNGTLSTSNLNFQTNGSTSDTSSLAGVIGSSLTGTSENFPGRIAEILVYGQDDDTMRTAVHTYFQTTYGIAMADATGVVDEWVVSGDTTT